MLIAWRWFALQIKQNIASTLKRMKVERERNMEEFSEELTIAKSTLQSYINEDEKANPTIRTLEVVASKLGITVSELIADPSEPDPRPLYCDNCIWTQINSLHPKLRVAAKKQMEIWLELSRCMYEKERGE